MIVSLMWPKKAPLMYACFLAGNEQTDLQRNLHFRRRLSLGLRSWCRNANPGLLAVRRLLLRLGMVRLSSLP